MAVVLCCLDFYDKLPVFKPMRNSCVISTAGNLVQQSLSRAERGRDGNSEASENKLKQDASWSKLLRVAVTCRERLARSGAGLGFDGAFHDMGGDTRPAMNGADGAPPRPPHLVFSPSPALPRWTRRTTAGHSPPGRTRLGRLAAQVGRTTL